METGNHRGTFYIFDDEHQRIGKALKQHPANVFVYDRELSRVGGDVFHRGVDRG